MAERLLDVEGLRVAFATEAGPLQAVDDVSFTLDRGEVLAVVGESGSGKSVTAMTLLGLTRSPAARIAGSARLDGTELLDASEEALRAIRGARIALVPQDPMTALDPVYRIGDQIAERVRAHHDVSRDQALQRAVEALERAGVPGARERMRAFPHELSGGLRQRVLIALALSCSPDVLIADEPTTAVDVTVEAQILAELRRLRDETGAGVVLITHDLGVVADIADRVAVVYAGRVVETGTLDELFYDPQHPYTWGLLGSIARIDGERPRRLPAIPGAPPSLLHAPEGCHFRPRCPHEFGRCTELPALKARADPASGHADRCWLTPGEKRRLRDAGGRIGLAAKGPA